MQCGAIGIFDCLADGVGFFLAAIGRNDGLASDFARELDASEGQAQSGIGCVDDGLYDRLLDFSQAVSGAHFFAPSLPVLRGFGGG